MPDLVDEVLRGVLDEQLHAHFLLVGAEMPRVVVGGHPAHNDNRSASTRCQNSSSDGGDEAESES